MTASDSPAPETRSGLPSPEDARAILHELAGPYLRRTGLEKPAANLSLPGDSPARRDIARFESVALLFGSLPEALPDPLIVVNEEGSIVLANSRTAEMFGYRREELLGAPVELLMPVRFHPRHVGQRDEYFRNPKPRPMGAGLKLFGVRKDGAEFPVEISLNPLTTPEGPVVVSTIRDISERVRLEARYRTLVEEIPAVTFMAALDEGVSELYVSPQIEDLLGFSQQEWLEDPILWYKQLHPADQTRWHTEFAQTCATGGPFRAEYRFVAHDGRVVWVLGEAKVVRDEAGRPLFMQGIAFDITKMKEAEAKLLAHQEDLERLVAEKTAKLTEKIADLAHFNHFAGHELRKPIRKIKDEMTDPLYLTKGRNLAAVRQMADWVRTQAQDGLARIEAMLRWARVDGQQGKRLVPYDAQSIFATACTMLQETIARIGANVTSGALPVVMGVAPDQGQLPDLVFLFENLINNALKYRTPDRPPRVHVEAQRRGGEWLFSFRDNGIGIEAKYFDGSVKTQIFNMFDRLHSESKIPGHGIGLAYCKRVVESLGGKIEVESEVGKGSTFLFTLPAAADDRPAGAATVFAAELPASPNPKRAEEKPRVRSRKKKPGGRANARGKDLPRSGRRRT
jgi:PAS domain S-box-containing protein